MPWERSIGKASASKLKIYAKKDGRYDVSWYDQAGKRHISTRQTLAAAKFFQAQKIAELKRHRQTKFDVDDREMYSQARDIAFQYDALIIEIVEMLENGKPVAADQHLAPAGPGYDNNEFRLNISKVDPSAKYSLRAWVHSLAGNDSTGYVTVSPPKG